jgi:Ni2+-binding GTPase involved in maturation of urease and hydrogenase
MGMLKPATNKQAYAKVGIYGTAGSGKTRTAS